MRRPPPLPYIDNVPTPFARWSVPSSCMIIKIFGEAYLAVALFNF